MSRDLIRLCSLCTKTSPGLVDPIVRSNVFASQYIYDMNTLLLSTFQKKPAGTDNTNFHGVHCNMS